MIEGKTGLLLLKGVISEAAPEEQVQIHECADEIRAIVSKHGEFGQVSLALVATEFTIQWEKEGIK